MLSSRTFPRLIRLSLRMSAPLFVVIAIVFAAVATTVFLMNGKSEKTARDAATRFAAALVHNDPGAASVAGGDDVRRLRTHFGAVTGARVISVHDKYVNSLSSRNRRSFVVAELLLRTARGPAVIELEFPGAPFSDHVSGVHELAPGRASGLSTQQRLQLASAYRARGGLPADEIAFGDAHSTAPPPVAESPAPARRNRRPRSAAQQLRCVERAGDDVAKLLECARS
jgi:hypothetical protein